MVPKIHLDLPIDENRTLHFYNYAINVASVMKPLCNNNEVAVSVFVLARCDSIGWIESWRAHFGAQVVGGLLLYWRATSRKTAIP